MRDALLRDLAQLPYEITTTVDARLAAPVLVPSAIFGAIKINENDDIWQVWEQQIRAADAVWLIAPETDGLLKKLTELAVRHHKKVIGCGLHAIEVASSKLATYHVLQQADIATIPTFRLENWPKSAGTWLAKPNDGAGCEETFYFKKVDELTDWISAWNKAGSHIVQPFITGISASISCVMQHGKAQVLSGNTQLIEIKNSQLKFKACIVNGMREHWVAFESVANKIARALPDLAGYVGIDVIVKGEKVIVVEINPRLTTSYCGLARAIGVNPAALIINTLMQENFVWPTLQRNLVEIHV